MQLIVIKIYAGLLLMISFIILSFFLIETKTNELFGAISIIIGAFLLKQLQKQQDR
jgi:hypothetical protein